MEPYTQQLIDYMEGKRKEFTMPLRFARHPFPTIRLESFTRNTVWTDSFLFRYRRKDSKSEISSRGRSCNRCKSSIDHCPLPSCHRKKWQFDRFSGWFGNEEAIIGIGALRSKRKNL